MVLLIRLHWLGNCLDRCGEDKVKRRNADPIGISVIEMHVRPTLVIMSTGHNINAAGEGQQFSSSTIGWS